jgi:hypothetical protein
MAFKTVFLEVILILVHKELFDQKCSVMEKCWPPSFRLRYDKLIECKNFDTWSELTLSKNNAVCMN